MEHAHSAFTSRHLRASIRAGAAKHREAERGHCSPAFLPRRQYELFGCAVPKTADGMVPDRPEVCVLNATLGTAPPGGNSGNLATRIVRPGTPTSSCAFVIAPTPFNIDTGSFLYNVHYITNSGGSPLCTTVILHVATEGTPVTDMQCSAFMAPFAAGDITNPVRYLGDSGTSTGNPPADTAFQLTVPASTTIALVVFNVNVSPAGQGTLYQLILDQDTLCQQATPTPTPTATPSPSATECPRPTPGTCTSYEAESNTLTGSAFALSCPTCSGGEKVGYVGNNSGTLQFNAVGVVVPGNHTLTICYTNGDAVRYALLSVNGGSGMPVSFPSTGSFQTVGSIQTTVFLNTGCNTLEFYNPIVGSWAPDFDRIQFNCPTCTVSTPTPTPTPTPRPTPTPAPSATCSQLQQRLNRLERRQRRLQRRHRQNPRLNRRIRRLQDQLQVQHCV